MNWGFLKQLAETFGTLSAILTVAGLIIGGYFALTRYRREVRLRAADLILKMEEEYRLIAQTCLDLEFLDRYQHVIVPVLKKVKDKTMQATKDVEALAKLDRCLRFFFLCTILTDLRVEETAIARAYYYYLSILGEAEKRIELQEYIATNFKRLNTWMKRHRNCMAKYRDTGEWDRSMVLLDVPPTTVPQIGSPVASGAGESSTSKQ